MDLNVIITGSYYTQSAKYSANEEVKALFEGQGKEIFSTHLHEKIYLHSIYKLALYKRVSFFNFITVYV